MKWFFLITGLVSGLLVHSQNIGIGTTTPAAKLQINHRSQPNSPGILLMDSTASQLGSLRFRNTGATKFVELYGYIGANFSNQTYLDVQSDSTFIATFRGNGNVGIRTVNPTFPLDVNGEIRSSSLAGSGNRAVYASSNGRLYASTTEVDTLTVSVNAKAFTHFGSTAFTLTTNTWRAYMNNGSTFQIDAPITFPDRVRLTKMKVIFLDNSSNDLEFTFLSSPVGGPGISPYVTVATSGASGAERSIEVNLFHTVNNAEELYAITVNPVAGHTWNGSILYVKGILFSYIYQ